jgi:dephospho-CoA kinase
MNTRKKKRCVVMGVTGGVASGKSSVVKEFIKLGAKVIDSDVIARDIVRPETSAWRKIVRYFGRDILLPNGLIDRKRLAGRIFSGSKEKKVLEKITHPVIIKEIKKQLRFIVSSFDGLVIIDVPLLFEAGLENIADKILVVWVPEKVQVARLMRRDGLSEKEAVRRIDAQMPLNKKIKSADYVINNSQTARAVKQTIYFLFSLLTKSLN